MSTRALDDLPEVDGDASLSDVSRSGRNRRQRSHRSRRHRSFADLNADRVRSGRRRHERGHPMFYDHTPVSSIRSMSIGDDDEAKEGGGEEEDGDEERPAPVRLMNADEQKEAAERDRIKTSFEVDTLCVDREIIFPSDVNADTMKEEYERANDPLATEVEVGLAAPIKRGYCYLCEADKPSGRNAYLNQMNELSTHVTRKSTQMVIDLMYTYYTTKIGKDSKMQRMGRTAISEHYMYHAPNRLWQRKQDHIRQVAMEDIVLRNIIHSDSDGTNPRLVMDNVKTYMNLLRLNRETSESYFKLVDGLAGSRK